jgi:hypothetical protein
MEGEEMICLYEYKQTINMPLCHCAYLVRCAAEGSARRNLPSFTSSAPFGISIFLTEFLQYRLPQRRLSILEKIRFRPQATVFSTDISILPLLEPPDNCELRDRAQVWVVKSRSSTASSAVQFFDLSGAFAHRVGQLLACSLGIVPTAGESESTMKLDIR